VTTAADDDSCTFDVRLRVAQQEAGACDGASAQLKGLGSPMTVDPWAMGWERVTVKARKKGMRKRVLRARIAGTAGEVGKAKIALRCDAGSTVDGCADVFAEPSYCVLGGAARPRGFGLESSTLCGDSQSGAQPALQVPSLAVWQGGVWTCGASSPMGGFVAMPLEGGEPHRVAGGCSAVGTDGDSLLVLPRPGFDDPLPAAKPAGRFFVPPSSIPPLHARTIRAYDLLDDVPAGPYRTVFDLDTIPDGSPCGAMILDTLTGEDGILYAAGCQPTFFDTCQPQPFVCVFDTTTGAVKPELFLEDFDGPIRGLAAMPGGRLAVLTNDPTQLPPIGYVNDPGPSAGGSDQIHIFDVTDGSRLDSKATGTSGASGLSCHAR
jgi:hypothetical protein